MATAVPYKRISATELQVTLDDNLLKRQGARYVVKNPERSVNEQWGMAVQQGASLVTFASRTCAPPRQLFSNVRFGRADIPPRHRERPEMTHS